MEELPKELRTIFAVSATKPAEATSFAIRKGDIADRLDVNYWQLTPLVNRRLENSRFRVVPLDDLLTSVQYGCSSLSKDHQPGVPILRMNNIQDDRWDLDSLKYVQLNARQLAAYRLVPGDILINRTNSKELVGKCAVFEESGDWVFASYLVRMRTDASLLLPQFAADFLATETGRLQIDRLSRQIIGMTNINSEELRALRIPLPPIDRQRRLVSEMDEARRQRRDKLRQAQALLLGVDAFVMRALGVDESPSNARQTFAVALGDLRSAQRLNPDYYHPERLQALGWLRDISRDVAVKSLVAAVTFVRETSPSPGSRYLGLANIQSHTGELLDVAETTSGSCFAYESNDVLFARLRPYLNKVHLAESAGCCSTEFYVLRINSPHELSPGYLAALLRSRLVLSQATHMVSGNTHPRVTNSDIANLQIPIPSKDIQEIVVSEVLRRKDRARRLRHDATVEWQSARISFEERLLGGITV